MDRFTRFKILRAFWARARTLLAWLAGPHAREAQIRAHRWQQIQVAERQTRDGIIRSAGDPDSYVRPQGPPSQHEQVWRAQWEGQKRWFEDHQRQAQQQAQQRRGR
jgi:hypothetical protein